MKVKDLIEQLQQCSPEAQVEYLVPGDDPEGPPTSGDLCFIEHVEDTFLGDPKNRFVVLSAGKSDT